MTRVLIVAALKDADALRRLSELALKHRARLRRRTTSMT